MLEKLRQFLEGSRFGPAEVKAAEKITPHMVRVTLQSEVAREFSPDCAGAHLKLVVPAKDQNPSAFEAFVEAGQYRPEMRTYTIRHARPDQGEIDIDIVTHGDLGRVGPWAQRTKAGDALVISRCGSPKLITSGAKRILAAADMTGFPALAAGLETLGDNVAIDAFVEILSDHDKQPIKLPSGQSVHWIVKTDPYAPSTDLIDAIKGAATPDASTSVFVAGEFTAVAELRHYFQNELKVDKTMRYISSYWKAGLDENGHKQAKAAAA
ncbi:MAG: siderophore-interacting protein [Pseudomonadota bacterium]